MRKPFVAGNWKMNLVNNEAVELTKALAEKAPADKIDLGVCPPYVYLNSVSSIISSTDIRLGAQDVWHEPKGAFTGEISCTMLKDVGCEYVILGHSERRHVIGESDELTNTKLKAAIEAGLEPILCVGETLEQRDSSETEQIIENQLAKGLAGIDSDKLVHLVIAYEPVWAIGTGRNATPDQAQQVHKFIRNWISQKLGQKLAENIRIQYGGSVKPKNAEEIMSQPDVDGALVGGASLKSEDFLAIIDATIKAKKL